MRWRVERWVLSEDEKRVSGDEDDGEVERVEKMGSTYLLIMMNHIVGGKCSPSTSVIVI
jgi:hypothetical protein